MPRHLTRCLPLFLTAGLLASCSWLSFTPQTRGNNVDQYLLKELVVGTSSRADVTSLLGSPTAKGTFDDNTWIYIGEVTQPRIGRKLGINSQNVVVMNFDQTGILRGLKHLDKNDGQDVAVVSRATPSPGSESSFFQQLLGNVGKFSPAPELGGKPAGSGGSTGNTLGGS